MADRGTEQAGRSWLWSRGTRPAERQPRPSSRQAQDRLHHWALGDGLTGLPSRALLLARLDRVLSAASEPGTLAVLVVDLDSFAGINQLLGYGAGDLVLTTTAERLVAAVGAGGAVARGDGDTFVLVSPWLSDREAALQLAGRVRTAVAEPVAFRDIELRVTARVGAVLAGDPCHPEELLRMAAAAARAAEPGQAGIQLFDQALRERMGRQDALDQVLIRALRDDLVTVAYQPVVDMVTGAVVGLEALMRLRAEDGQLLTPSSFLARAEHSGQLLQLEQVVLDRATDDLTVLRRTHPDLTMAVNVCAAALMQSDLEDRVDRALRRNGLPASALVIEVTEHTLLSADADTVARLRRLVGTGVRLALDDFGTGYASLSNLRHFPLGEIKIDRSFVVDLVEAPDALAIVRAVLTLARELGLICVAEGIETPEQRAVLVALGGRLAQGYGYASPLPLEELVGYLQASADAFP